MKYSAKGLEKIEVTDTYRAASKAHGLVVEAMSLVGPDTESFSRLCLAKAELGNWCEYLASGGAERYGAYETDQPARS